MPVRTLTPKQERFCIAFIEENNGPGAYLKAYEPKASKRATLYSEAARLLATPHVKARIAELRAQVAERSGILVADVIKQLWDNAMKAKEAEPLLNRKGEIVGYTAQLAASNQALIAVGNHLGAFAKKDAEQVADPIEALPHEAKKALVAWLEAAKAKNAPRPVDPPVVDGVVPGTRPTLN